jgi:hypothetical protein
MDDPDGRVWFALTELRALETQLRRATYVVSQLIADFVLLLQELEALRGLGLIVNCR